MEAGWAKRDIWEAFLGLGWLVGWLVGGLVGWFVCIEQVIRCVVQPFEDRCL